MSDDMSGSLLPYIPILYTFIDSLIHPEPTGRDDQKLTPGKVLVHWYFSSNAFDVLVEWGGVDLQPSSLPT